MGKKIVILTLALLALVFVAACARNTLPAEEENTPTTTQQETTPPATQENPVETATQEEILDENIDIDLGDVI